jgi:hypothetical protein
MVDAIGRGFSQVVRFAILWFVDAISLDDDAAARHAVRFDFRLDGPCVDGVDGLVGRLGRQAAQET